MINQPIPFGVDHLDTLADDLNELYFKLALTPDEELHVRATCMWLDELIEARRKQK
jgi:hypothetical protein